MDLNSTQRSYLTRMAQGLEPVVLIGKFGLTEPVVKAIDKALEDHELIKVRFNAFKEEREALSLQVQEKTNSTLVRMLGNLAVLYRWNPDQTKRKVRLPKA